jgi:hypothetical protein
VAFGAIALIAPRFAGRAAVGIDADNAGASVLTRALGARDAVLGGMLLHVLDTPQVAQRWIATCGVVDLVDGSAVLAARRELPASKAAPFLAIALGSAVAHLVLSRRVTAPSGLENAAARSTPAPASSPETVEPEGAEEAKRAMGARTIGVDTPK